MPTILEALKIVKTVNEGFRKIDLHYEYNPDQPVLIDDESGRKYHPHVLTLMGANKLANKQKDKSFGFKTLEYPCYLFLSKNEYGNEAEQLAKESSSNNTDRSTHTGVESFLGTKAAGYPDCIYKIRWKSNLLNKNYLKNYIKSTGLPESLADSIWNEFTATFKTDQFCDVVVYKNNYAQATNPDILTFYPATITDALNTISKCKVFSAEDSVIGENNVEGKFIILDSLHKNYSKNNPPENLQAIVFHPETKVSSNNSRKGGTATDVNTSYVGGYFIDPKDGQRYEITEEDIEKATKNDNLDASSKYIENARQRFERAALAAYCRSRNTTYRASTVDSIRSNAFWANSVDEAMYKFKNDPVLNSERGLFGKWYMWKGSNEAEVARFNRNMYSIKISLKDNWSK